MARAELKGMLEEGHGGEAPWCLICYCETVGWQTQYPVPAAQVYGVYALCSFGCYEEAWKLLQSIQRKPGTRKALKEKVKLYYGPLLDLAFCRYKAVLRLREQAAPCEMVRRLWNRFADDAERQIFGPAAQR